MANILLIEDNESLRLAYSSFLGQEGHQVFPVSNVDDALVYLVDNTPEIILLDMLLPKKNGLNLLEKYDVVTSHPTVRVIALSNYTESQIQTEAGRLGVSMYITKSLTTPKELVDIINQVLSKQQ